MTQILITSCHKCKPEVWTAKGKSRATYICQTCDNVFKKVLERTTKNEHTLGTTKSRVSA